MLVGQNLGPFRIDRELGSGAMGAVYRGRYEKTGQLVAVKVMAPGLGSTNANAAARFEREAAILKQFNHPNIVRLFGIGKSHGTRYYAMEYIEGESLDRVMSRRSRMTWEEVVTLGQQLCAALQHAHEQGVIHRDLKPSNLMILKDGTLKLTDFGIAKDMDVTRLTSANCTVGTAAYMSPEQCRGDPDLTHKSDLYSLGVVFYELITGHKPFEAENAMDMFMQHVQGTFVRPAKRVLDIPVWLDNLICQLLEKKPEHRPLDAATIYVALGKIQEKVEAQLSAGVEAAKQRVIDRPRGDAPPDETDREMARTLLVGKGKKKRRIKRQKFYEKGWFVIAGLFALFGALGLALFLVLRPPPPEKFYEDAEKLMKSSSYDDHATALEQPIKKYLRYYGDRPGEQTEQVKKWKDQASVEDCEIKLYKFLKLSNNRMYDDEGLPKGTLDALKDEQAGDLVSAIRRWREIAKSDPDASWALTVAGRLNLLEQAKTWDEEWKKLVETSVNSGREPEQADLPKRAFRAYRAEHLGERYDQPEDVDLSLAYQIYEDIAKDAQGYYQKLAESPQKKADEGWYILAANKKHELKSQVAKIPDAAQKREEIVARAVAKAKEMDKRGERAALSLSLDLVALYGEDPELRGQLEPVKQIVKKFADFQKPQRSE
jgi:serine/threonine-protein kinase